MDCRLWGSSVHAIFQARVLEWVAISFSRGSFWPRDQTRVSHIADRRFTIWTTREATLSSATLQSSEGNHAQTERPIGGHNCEWCPARQDQAGIWTKRKWVGLFETEAAGMPSWGSRIKNGVRKWPQVSHRENGERLSKAEENLMSLKSNGTDGSEWMENSMGWGCRGGQVLEHGGLCKPCHKVWTSF